MGNCCITQFQSCLMQLPCLLVSFNPFHLNISMHILLTVLYTFPVVLTMRICFTIKNLFSW